MPRKSKRTTTSPYARPEQTSSSVQSLQLNSSATDTIVGATDNASLLSAMDNMLASLNKMSERIGALESKETVESIRPASEEITKQITMGETSMEEGIGNDSLLITNTNSQQSLPSNDIEPSISTNAGFKSTAISISSRIPMKLKQKIWAGEYIDIGDLLDERIKNDDERFQLEFSPNNPNQALFFVPKAKKGYLSILNWSRAFNRYIFIAGLNQPSKVPSMQQHMEIIFSLHQEGADWMYYVGWSGDFFVSKEYRHIIYQMKALH